MQQQPQQLNRRRFDRFTLQPMYTDVHVQRVSGGRMTTLAGYAYDISEGGIRIDLDERLELGEHVNLSVSLPNGAAEPLDISAACQVVRVSEEDDDPAMPRAALRIEKFFDEAARSRLTRYLGSGLAHRVA